MNSISRSTTVRAILTRALGLVQSGWTQGANHIVDHGRDRYCARGAILATNPRRPYLTCQAFNLLQGSARVTSIVRWNDSPKRTKKSVVSAFKRAIARA
jgi:hypothetical protein